MEESAGDGREQLKQEKSLREWGAVCNAPFEHIQEMSLADQAQLVYEPDHRLCHRERSEESSVLLCLFFPALSLWRLRALFWIMSFVLRRLS